MSSRSRPRRAASASTRRRGRWRPSGSCSRPAASRCRRRAATAHGLAIARALGHSVVPTTPALAPLVLAGSFHARLSGVAQEAELTVRAAAEDPRAGTWLAPLDALRRQRPGRLSTCRARGSRARLEGAAPVLEASFVPGTPFESLEQQILDRARESPRLGVARALGLLVPAAVAEAFAGRAGCRRTRRSDGSVATTGAAWSPASSRGRCRSRARGATPSPRRPRAACRSPRWTRARWRRGCARGSSSPARCWTSTAASAASTSSGRGRARGLRPGGLAR